MQYPSDLSTPPNTEIASTLASTAIAPCVTRSRSYRPHAESLRRRSLEIELEG